MAQVTELAATATPGQVHAFVAKTAAPVDEVTIDGATTHALAAQYDAIIIQSDGDDWYILASH